MNLRWIPFEFEKSPNGRFVEVEVELGQAERGAILLIAKTGEECEVSEDFGPRELIVGNDFSFELML